METVLQFLLDVAIVVGPTAGYVDQYFSMRKAGAVDGKLAYFCVYNWTIILPPLRRVVRHPRLFKSLN